ncbi:hypothetical protein BJX61DRAFT_530808 [Aspergillus egyptiacus]|nr:hypothetical protein BJX61DRAFT_530808 [Aspergillus egyptiacus]
MMASLKESLAGPGYVILNAIRVINIVVFLDMVAAHVVMLVKINLLTPFFFFQAVSHAVAIGISIFLLVSELPFFRGYFDRHWPSLGEDSGFVSLAFAMLILGVGTLGDLNTPATSQEELGMTFWRIIISAGILALIVSVINVIANFAFADRDIGVSARHVRVYGAVAPHKVASRTGSQRSFQLSYKREETLPSYNSPSPVRRSSTASMPRIPIKISPPLHPMRMASNAGYAPSSKYSRDSSGQNIQSILLILGPIVLPRIINFIRYTRVALTQRPQPRPLPPGASRALNVLFLSTLVFLILSHPSNPYSPSPSIFSLTRSRINTPLDTIFARLARLREPYGVLTQADELLRSKLVSKEARRIYLRYGEKALTQCRFCKLDNATTFALFYYPLNSLVPHLLHMAVVGITTSATFAGREAARWRSRFTLAGLLLAALDTYVVFMYDPVKSGSEAVRASIEVPPPLFQRLAVVRPLALAIFDVVLAGFIYVTATNRWFFTPPSQADEVDRVVSASLASLTGASAKLHAASVTRNAVVRDKVLKDRDDAYWQTVVAMDGEGGSKVPSGVWEEEEVVRAMSRAMAGQGGVDLARLGVSAAEYVNGVTAGLERGRVQESS